MKAETTELSVFERLKIARPVFKEISQVAIGMSGLVLGPSALLNELDGIPFPPHTLGGWVAKAGEVALTLASSKQAIEHAPKVIDAQMELRGFYEQYHARQIE